MSALSVEGISLAHYAAVKAAVAEGFPDAEVLAAEGLPARRWARADPGWKLRLVDDREAFAAYTAELAEAEDRLDREVSPLGDDLASWASFLSAFAVGGAELLRAHDLRLSDVARLRRRWARRVEQDAALGGRLDEFRKQPAALPAIRVAPAVLRPSRFAEGRVAPEGAQATARPAEPALTLDRYAALCAEIAERPAEVARSLSRYGLSDEVALAALDGLWRAELERSPPLAADFRRLFAHNRARLSAPGRPAPEALPEPAAPAGHFHAAPPSIRAALSGTALVLDLPARPAMPFAAPAPGEKAPTLPAAAAPVAHLGTGTALALDVPRGDALPFAREAAPAPSAPAGLLSAAAVVEVPPGPALPFVASRAPRELPPAPEVAPKALAGLGSTAPALPARREPPLPFAPPAALPEPAKKNKLGNRAISLDIPSSLRAAPEAATALTVEQYASFCVELSMSPGAEVEILARYRLTAQGRQALDGYYVERMAKDPALRHAWEQAYLTYHTWLLASRRGAP